MKDAGTAVGVFGLMTQLTSRDVDALVAELGRFVLLGTLDERERSGWSFSTVPMAAPALEAELGSGFDLSRSALYPLRKRTLTFPNVLLLGRSSSNDVQISHDSVSKLHARIWTDSDGFLLEDAGSRNGTFLGDRRIGDRVAVRPGDRVGFGTRDFYVHDSRRLLQVLRRLHRA